MCEICQLFLSLFDSCPMCVTIEHHSNAMHRVSHACTTYFMQLLLVDLLRCICIYLLLHLHHLHVPAHLLSLQHLLTTMLFLFHHAVAPPVRTVPVPVVHLSIAPPRPTRCVVVGKVSRPVGTAAVRAVSVAKVTTRPVVVGKGAGPYATAAVRTVSVARVEVAAAAMPVVRSVESSVAHSSAATASHHARNLAQHAEGLEFGRRHQAVLLRLVGVQLVKLGAAEVVIAAAPLETPANDGTRAGDVAGDTPVHSGTLRSQPPLQNAKHTARKALERFRQGRLTLGALKEKQPKLVDELPDRDPARL